MHNFKLSQGLLSTWFQGLKNVQSPQRQRYFQKKYYTHANIFKKQYYQYIFLKNLKASHLGNLQAHLSSASLKGLPVLTTRVYNLPLVCDLMGGGSQPVHLGCGFSLVLTGCLMCSGSGSSQGTEVQPCCHLVAMVGRLTQVNQRRGRRDLVGG